MDPAAGAAVGGVIGLLLVASRSEVQPCARNSPDTGASRAFGYPLLVALRSRSHAIASAARCPERMAPSIELVSRWSPQA